MTDLLWWFLHCIEILLSVWHADNISKIPADYFYFSYLIYNLEQGETA